MNKVKYIIFLCLLWSVISTSNAEEVACNGSANYNLVFQAEWTSQSHPEDFPSDNGPHFSKLVGCSHNNSYVMWKPGMNASLGVKNVAERGRNGEMVKEINKEISLKKAFKKFEGEGSIGNAGSTTVYVQVDSQYPLVSAISMIAPSPDWFVGVHDDSLCDEKTGKWVEKKVKDLFVYDAGTDSAPRFVHTDTPTDPPVPIFLITNTTEGSLKSNNAMKRFGTFTFEKTSEAPPDAAYSFARVSAHVFQTLIVSIGLIIMHFM